MQHQAQCSSKIVFNKKTNQFSLVGMKCAILLNRSTTTMIASNPLYGGKLTMKSMDTVSHGPSGIGNGNNNPFEARSCRKSR
jgi:hypothetical protein